MLIGYICMETKESFRDSSFFCHEISIHMNTNRKGEGNPSYFFIFQK